MPASLREQHPGNYTIPLTLCASACLLVFGLFLPIITLKELVFWQHTFSVITGIQNLFTEGHIILALIILLFSIIFPIFKLLVLFQVWYSRLGDKQRKFYVHWLGILGKWSMLDVFVVAITIVITKISSFAKAEPRIGLYFFGVSIVLAMLVTEAIDRLMRKTS